MHKTNPRKIIKAGTLLEALGLKTAHVVADEVLELLQPQELQLLKRAIKTHGSEKIAARIDELMRAAVNNLIDDVVWDIPFYRDVKNKVYAKLAQ